jgi:tRNA (guanine-N7-)-methyltransferase
MRMHKKKNLAPRMERAASVLLNTPSEYKGRWLEAFPGYNSLYVELGCGKGTFTVNTAKTLPDTLFIAIERVRDAMIMAMEKACSAELQNVRFADMDAALLLDTFNEGEADRIYINFCDPWPKSKQAKRRLTAPGFLAIYKQVLKKGGEIHFKTDNIDLFRYSLITFRDAGLELSEVTENLHKDGPTGIMTDYETKFYSEGLPIFRAVARNI